MSTFACPVVPVSLTAHPNADSLSVATVDGFPVCVKTADWEHRDRGVYIPVDSLVDTARPEFSFLADRANDAGKARIKALKLRGVFSQGLLVPADPRTPIGVDMSAELAVEKYEAPLTISTGGDDAPPPAGIIAPMYTEIEHLRKYAHLFERGEEVVVTEKIHGANARYVGEVVEEDGYARTSVVHAGSHKRWIKKGTSIWWQVPSIPAIDFWCHDFPGMVLFGEVYGKVQDLRYGLDNGLAFRVFDVFDGTAGRYFDYDAFLNCFEGLEEPKPAPLLYRGPFDFKLIEDLAEQDSSVCPGQLMEGVVVRPVRERWDPEVGRVCLKFHSQRFLLRKGA